MECCDLSSRILDLVDRAGGLNSAQIAEGTVEYMCPDRVKPMLNDVAPRDFNDQGRRACSRRLAGKTTLIDSAIGVGVPRVYAMWIA